MQQPIIKPIINENGLKLYPIGENQVYIFVSVFKDTPFINIRMVLHDGQLITRDGVSLSNYELTKFREICPELQLAIREMNSRDFLLGNYKLVRYEADGKFLQFSKIQSTQDQRGPNVCLIGDEIPAFFATLEKVEQEFHETWTEIREKTAAEQAVADLTTMPAMSSSSSRKRGATPPATPAFSKFVKLEPQVLDSIDLTDD